MAKKSQYHHGDLRRELIDRAIEVIGEKGVEGVSLRALARDIGVSHGAPIRHFPTRSDLLAAIALDGVASLFKSAVAHTEEEGLTSFQKIRAMTEGYIGWARVNPVHHLILRNRDVMRYADETLIGYLNKYSALMKSMIEQAQIEGWRADCSPRSLFLQIVSITAGLALVVTDPLYHTPLQGTPEADDVQTALDDFFA